MNIIVYNTEYRRSVLRMVDGMKRNRNEIISEILNICTTGSSKTRVVYQANLNFRTVDPYLQLLIKNDLIRVNQGRHILYETTEKGKCLMETINQVHNTLSEDQGALIQPTSAI
jgi:predicted transcriptional regulator